MLSVRDLHRFARTLSAAQFETQLGPFVLVQAAPDAIKQAEARKLGAGRTLRLDQPSSTPASMNLLMSLEHLMVANLPTIDDQGFTIGRAPDNDLVLDDASVSKRHARITWDASAQAAVVEDLGSSNGTQHNGRAVSGQVSLYTGDELHFAESRFCYLLTRALYAHLVTGQFQR